MKIKILRRALPFAFLPMLILIGGSNADAQVKADVRKGIFPQGKQGHATNFTGKAYAIGLVDSDSVYSTVVGNVYFEAGARSNWHSHPGGQILIITDEVGYHQIKGQPKQILHKGDVVKYPPNILHWHGASPDIGMQQMYIIPNSEKGIVEWKEAVTDRVYKGN